MQIAKVSLKPNAIKKKGRRGPLKERVVST